MKIRILQGVLLVAVLLGAAAAYAQTAPTPAKAPPRVPFSAFRTKPILDLKTPEGQAQGSSLVVQDKAPPKKKAPAKTIVIRESSGAQPVVRIRPAAKPSVSAVEVMDAPKKMQDDIIFSPQMNAPLVAASQPLRIARGGVPVPPRKPAVMSTTDSGDFNVIERVLAEPVEAQKEAPRPPQDKAEIIALPSAKPVVGGSVRIRDNNRFSAHNRMAGSGSDVKQPRSLRSLGLPEDMQDLRLGSLKQGKGVSPVLMPGQNVTKAAPDDKRVDSRGVPNEVIVFFQENTADLEVGQLDVVMHDVVEVLKARPELSLEIVGYSEPQQSGKDGTGKMALSRALMIQQYLTRQRVSSDRLTVDAKGDDTPIEPRDRVEMYFDR